eukprot:COSAG01_NODE_145_length_24103_cov_41.178012_29_plen_51_part_00
MLAVFAVLLLVLFFSRYAATYSTGSAGLQKHPAFSLPTTLQPCLQMGPGG